MDFLEGLNDQQLCAVLQTEGPLLILAGAGSGKTKVLTHRIAYMINDVGISPSNILAITFTNKAAKEMKTRVEKLLDSEYLNMWISTFHSSCARILRMEIERLGYTRDYIIYDDTESLNVIKDVMKAAQISEKDINPRVIRDAISRAKDKMEGPAEFARLYGNDFIMGKYSTVYTQYQKRLKQNNALDFDDLIFLTVKLLEDNEDILVKYRNKFRYIMVDEYQDTNMAQYRLISLLASEHKNLCVVGDDDQSIYSFRGADITNILSFENEFKGCTVIRLEQNYRSTSNILNAANAVIKNNTKRKGKKLWTQNGDGVLIKRYPADNEHAEANFIVSEIKKTVREKGEKYSDFAVLYRINSLSRVMEEALMREAVPYKIIGGLKFYDRKEIKDIIAYLRLIQNTNDDYALKRIINVPKRGIGDRTFENLSEIAFEENKSIFDVICHAEDYPALGRASQKLASFGTLIRKYIVYKDEKKLSELIEDLIHESGMRREYEEENTPEANQRIENLMEFVSVAVEFDNDLENESVQAAETDDDFEEEELEGLAAFLESISLVTELDKEDGTGDYVMLMTMHSAKGLEFPTVFLIGYDDGIFPGTRSMDSEESIEEERRLCYVAITRAKAELYITNVNQRMLFGSTTYYKPSRFLQEIPAFLVEDCNPNKVIRKNVNPKDTGGMPKASFGKRIDSVNDINKGFLASLRRGNAMNNSNPAGNLKYASFAPGERVRHKKFGDGTITKVEPSGDDFKLEIEFDGVGMRRLMAAFANLVKI